MEKYCRAWQATDIDCKLSDGDRKLSKHVALYITQTHCCDIYCYGIDCVFVGYDDDDDNRINNNNKIS